MDKPSFVIRSEEADSAAKQLGVSVLELLPSLVKPATSYARPPISKFHVGAVGLGSSGRIFLGVNGGFPRKWFWEQVEKLLLTAGGGLMLLPGLTETYENVALECTNKIVLSNESESTMLERR